MYQPKQKRAMPFIFLNVLRIAVFQLIFFGLMAAPASAQNYIVNTAIDANVAVAGAGTGIDANGNICLRSAIQDATARPGAHIINIPAAAGATMDLTLGEIVVGDAAIGNQITVNGPGKGLLTISQTTVNRIFSTGAGAVIFELTDLTLNYNGPVGTIGGGGGAIAAGGVGASTTLINVAITNFNIQTGNGGAILCSTAGNNGLTLTNCDFTDNYCGGAGGAVSYVGNSGCTITGCTFTNNRTGPKGTNVGGGGAALNISGTGAGGTNLIEKCTFLNNQVLNAAAYYGAVLNHVNGTTTLRLNRFVNNTCAAAGNGQVIYQGGGVATDVVTANNNWWGASTGPGASDVGLDPGGTPPVKDSWLQLRHTASTSPVCVGETSTLTASFLTNNLNAAIAPADLTSLIGLPLIFQNAVNGNLSAAETSIQASGTATATFTATAAGNGTADAVFVPLAENHTVTTNPAIAVSGTNTITLTSAAGTDAQVACINTPITNITYATTGATGATFSGLPPGVMGEWLNNVVTISGSPSTTAGSPFNYSVNLTGGCGTTVTANGSITVSPVTNNITLTSAAGTDAQTVCINTPIISITYATTGATGATFSGLPPGMTFGWDANVVTISGAPSTVTGSPFNYTVTLTGGCGAASASGSITVIPIPEITAPTLTQPTCATPTGTIVINATGAGALEYSVDNGANWLGNATFSGLAPGNYNIKVRLQASPACETAYGANPVVLIAATGCCVPPTIIIPTITQPTCETPTGTLVVNATGASALEYSVDNGANWQASATFSGLNPGSYNIKVRLLASPTCEATYGNNPVIINAVPLGLGVLINADGPTTFCPGGSVTLTALTVGEYKLQLSSPLTNSFDIGLASFAAAVSTHPINGDIVYIPDYLGCSYAPGSLTGKVALIDRGGVPPCNYFSVKAKNAQDAGAIGVIIANNGPGAPPNMNSGTPNVIITIPVIGVSQQDGNTIKNLITLGVVNGSTVQQSTYSYLWSTGATTPSIVATQTNDYFVTVTGTNSCTGIAGISVLANAALVCPDDIVTANTPGICGAVVTYATPAIVNNCAPCTAPTALPNYTYLGEFGGHKYFRSNFNRTWGQAKDIATGLGAHLVTLSSEAESNFVSGNSQLAWIGLTDEAVEGTFVWANGEPVTYTNWWPGDPNNGGVGGDEDYVLMNFYGSTKWVDNGTNYFYPFIMEFDCGGVTQTAGLPSGSVFPVGVTTNSFAYTDAANNTVTCSFTVTVNDTEPPTLTCPANISTPATSPTGAVVNYPSPVLTDNCYDCVIPTAIPNYTYIGTMNGHTYFRSNFSRTWAQANTMATGLGGHLVTISSLAENNLVAGSSVAWIGLSRAIPGGPFGWVTAEPLAYTNWWPGEPNNSGGNENYAMINYFGNTPQWFDYGTNYFYPFIVEFECNPMLTQTAGLPSGATFPLGITINSFSYTDGGGNTATCSFTVEVTNAPPLPNPITQTDAENTMEVRTYPNPSAGDFTLLVISESNEPITVRILDETGNIKKVMMANSTTKTLKMGADLPAGKYVAEVIQGTRIKTVKLVKIN